MVKIIYVAVFIPTSTNVSQAVGFERASCCTIKYDYRQRRNEIGNKAMEEEVIELCKKERPELVVFSKCNGMSMNTIKQISAFSKTCLWYMDPISGFNLELIEKIKTATFTCCALWEPYVEAKKYSVASFFVHEGFDSDIDKPHNLEKTIDVSFIGNLRGHRKTFFNEIGFETFTNAYREEHAKVVSSTKINLNFTQGGTSDRTYKILAAKGFLLTERWPEMEKDFEIGKDLDVFDSIEVLRTKISYYLENNVAREQIAECGYRTVQKFSRENWAKRILEICRGSLNETRLLYNT